MYTNLCGSCHSSTAKKLLLLQEEDARTVQVKGTDVKIKTVTLEDASGKAKVTLWREACEADVRPGDFVTVTDVVVNHYKNESSLSTTSKTAVTVKIQFYLLLACHSFLWKQVLHFMREPMHCAICKSCTDCHPWLDTAPLKIVTLLHV